MIACRNGLPLPSTLEGLQGSDNGFFLAPSTEGHLFVSSGRELREVKVDANGITEVRNIDWAANPGGALSFHPVWLAFSKGRVVDLTTLKPKDDLATDATLLVDTSIPTLYRCRPVRALSPGDPLTVESFSPGTLEPLWRVELPGEQTLLGEFTQVVTLGRHGLLLVGTHALRLHPDIAGPTQADLTIGPQRYDSPWFPGVAQSVSLQLNQTGAWTARNAVLEIEVSGNLEWIEPAIALENGRGALSLGHLHGTTRLTPRGTSLQEGNQGITQAAVPVVLLDPADYPVEVHYQTRPGTATAGVDFQDVSGWLRFEPGQRTNHVFVPILGDVQFEATESLEVFLTETPNLLLTRPSAVVTLLNDDPAPALTLALRQHESGAWQVHFDTADGARYQLQVDDSLGDGGWENFGAPILGTGQPASFPIPASLAPSQFFRIRVD